MSKFTIKNNVTNYAAFRPIFVGTIPANSVAGFDEDIFDEEDE